MKQVIIIVFILASGCSRTTIEEPKTKPESKPLEISFSDAEELYYEHLLSGTLIDIRTASRFSQNGWGSYYARMIRKNWVGQSQAGISLQLEPLPDYSYRVGQKFDCLAVLTNGSDDTLHYNNGGNCGMTHALSILVVYPSGNLLSRCRGKVGGPHCFCQRNYEAVDPGESIHLVTGFASQAAVVWTLERSGLFTVIGTYKFESEKGEPFVVYSAPLVIDVEDE